MKFAGDPYAGGILVDPKKKHQIQIRMFGNSGVYVTCNCLVQRLPHTTRTKHQGRGAIHRWPRDAMASLGDFPVGTPIEELLAAYNSHLEG